MGVLWFILICLFPLTQTLNAGDENTSNIVSAAWLEQNINRADLLILDASSAMEYMAGHIPGAINIDLMTYGGKELSKEEMEKRFQKWGISIDRKIIIYDQGGSIMATKLFFDLHYHCLPVDNLFILDGGLKKWQEAGGSVTKEPTPDPKAGTIKITGYNEAERVKLPEVLKATGDQSNYALIEALDAKWHFGETQFFDRPGHIPNGILMPSTDFYNPDGTFKSVDEIKRMLNYLGIKPEQEIHTYCGGGIAASVPYFALKYMLHYPNVKLFRESELGWLRDERGLPYWTYDAPFLMRETKWLNTWGGRRMRMYGVSQISVIDVRPEDEFYKGHIPFSLNVTNDEFKNNLTNPDKLGETLGQAGVDAVHEAVIISGAGLNKESALAFVMLEKLGQKKVSILMDSEDKWEQLGLAVTKDTTIASSKKVPGDLVILSTAYQVNIREDVIIYDPTNSKDLYDKVFIASGKNIPMNTSDAKVVHVPYTELIKTDGTPKAAKDIWNILEKAGVPRYSELVCFSDDPGEAAVNYFILKLMGFPDVKVWVN